MSEAEEFLGIKSDCLTNKQPSEIKLKIKFIYIFIAWTIGFLTACPNPLMIQLIPFFPVPKLVFLLVC